MPKQATMQEYAVSQIDPSSLCSFDYEAIVSPTKALMHQAARFLYFRAGKGKIIINNKTYNITPHTIVAISPWQITDVPQVDTPLQLIKIVYDYQYIKSLLSHVTGFEEESNEILAELDNTPVFHLDSFQTNIIESILDDLKEELGVSSTLEISQEKPFTHLFTSNKVIELMLRYSRFVRAKDGRNSVAKKTSRGDSVLSYIYAHSCEHITLNSIAKMFYMSPSALSKHISDLTGSTFSKLLMSMRIEKASDYLIYSELTLRDIAEILGFVDASHLSKSFVSRVGVTPMKYRALHTKTKSAYSHRSKEVACAITEYMYKNYNNENLNANSVAQKFDLNISELNRALLYYSEKNFETLLNFIRINRACEELLDGENTIMQIAMDVGYTNIKTFNTNFFKFKEMTPSAFRASITLQHSDGSESQSKENI